MKDKFPQLNLKALLYTKTDPIQTINGARVNFIPVKKNNNDFMHVSMTMRKFWDKIEQYEADLWLNRPKLS